MALGSLCLGCRRQGLAQGNDAAAGSRRGRSFERLEELCQKAAGTPPATFWGVYGFVLLGCRVAPRTKSPGVFRSKHSCNYSSARIRTVLAPGRRFPRGTLGWDCSPRRLAVCGLRVAARTHRLAASGRCDTAAVTRVAVALPSTHEQRDTGGSACTNTERRWRAAARWWRLRWLRRHPWPRTA